MNEKKKIYLVIRIEFDNMENHNPIIESVYGCLDENISQSDAELYVTKLNELKGGHHRGYDNNYYPKFRLEKVDKLNSDIMFRSVGDARITRSFTIKFESIQELANILTELGLSNQFYVQGPKDQYPGTMCFYSSEYLINPNSNREVRVVVVNEMYDGNYIIYEDN